MSFLSFGPAAAPSQLQLENELLLELRLDGTSLGLDVLGYQRANDFLLSLRELANGLGFPITVDAAQGTASGWFINEGRLFSLDLHAGEVRSDEREWLIAEGDVVAFQGDLFVHTDALQQWFPLQLSAVVRQLYLDVVAEEILPIQRRFLPEERFFSNSRERRAPQYPLQETPYHLLGPHITRARFALSSVREDFDQDAHYQVNHALLSRGDLGWMTSTFALSGQTSQALSTARLKLERAALGAPLGLNHIEIGDLDAGGFRGLLLSSQDRSSGVGGRIDTDAVTLEGNQLPDWEVELYQNDQLILIQTVGPDGRYRFEDIPLVFGENRFELRFFGPFGETEIREEFHFLGLGMLDPGKISYGLSAAQSGRTVFGINEVEGDGERDSFIYSGNVNIGLSRHLTAGTSIRSIEKDGERENSTSFSLGLTTSRFFGNLNYVEPANSQASLGTSIRTQFGNTKLGVGYISFMNANALADNRQEWRGNIELSATIGRFPLKVEINALEQTQSRLIDAVIGTTVPLVGTGRLSSSIWHTSSAERANEFTEIRSLSGGQSSFHTILRPWAIRLSSSYSFTPETELLDLSFESNLRIERDLTLDFRIRKDTVKDTTYYGAGINWQLDPVTINAQIAFDSDERWTGLLTFSTSLIHAPGSAIPRFDSRTSVDAGIVEARIFESIDKDTLRPVPDIGVSAVQAWKRAVSDEKGIAYLTRMPAHQQVDIELDESTIVDSELRSSKPGVSIIARPGTYSTVEFPLIRTAELEGHVYEMKGENQIPVARALLTLKSPDGSIVAQRRTAFDGFYLFDGIQPGSYEIALEEAFSGRLLRQPGTVKVKSGNALIQSLDFALRQAIDGIDRSRSIAQVEPAPLVRDTTTASNNSQAPRLVAAEPIKLENEATQPDNRVLPIEENGIDQGQWYVQLGAYASAEVARNYWKELAGRSALLEKKVPKLESFRQMTRLLVSPSMSRDPARELCQALKADNIDCLLRESTD